MTPLRDASGQLGGIGIGMDGRPTEYSRVEIQAWTLTHEIGHALGASHSTDGADFMSASPPAGWGDFYRQPNPSGSPTVVKRVFGTTARQQILVRND